MLENVKCHLLRRLHRLRTTFIVYPVHTDISFCQTGIRLDSWMCFVLRLVRISSAVRRALRLKTTEPPSDWGNLFMTFLASVVNILFSVCLRSFSNSFSDSSLSIYNHDASGGISSQCAACHRCTYIFAMKSVAHALHIVSKHRRCNNGHHCRFIHGWMDPLFSITHLQDLKQKVRLPSIPISKKPNSQSGWWVMQRNKVITEDIASPSNTRHVLATASLGSYTST